MNSICKNCKYYKIWINMLTFKKEWEYCKKEQLTNIGCKEYKRKWYLFWKK